MEKNTQYIVLGIAVLFGMIGVIIGNHSSFESDLEALKPVPRENQVTLSVIAQAEDGLFKPVSDNVPEEAKLAFQITSNKPIYMSLIVAVNDQAPEVLLKSARIPPGVNKQVDNDGVRYIYQLLPEQQSLKFCVIEKDNNKSLREHVRNLDEEWPQIPEPQCHTIVI